MKPQPTPDRTPRTEVVLLDSDFAELLLEKNRSNRKLRLPTVEKYARLMAEGHWILNNDAIVVSYTDELLNGQHRLRAVVKSGRAVPMLILWNADPAAFEMMDRALPRSVGDALAQLGHVNTATLASALRVYSHLESGDWDTLPLEPRAAVELLGRLPNFTAAFIGSKAARGVMTPGLGMALYYIFHKLDPLDAEGFFGRVGTGAELTLDSPIYRLRERLRRTRGVQLSRRIEAALTIKAWNAWRRNRPLQALGWREDEAFPKPL